LGRRLYGNGNLGWVDIVGGLGRRTTGKRREEKRRKKERN